MGILLNLQNTLAVVRKKRFYQNLHRKIIFHCLLSAKFPKLPEEKVSENVTVRVLDGVPTMQPLPYQLKLQYIKYDIEFPHCGATLLSQSVALTAYHCLSYKNGGMVPWKTFVVYAGAIFDVIYHFNNEKDKRVKN